MKKRILSILITLTLVLSVCSCSDNSSNTEQLANDLLKTAEETEKYEAEKSKTEIEEKESVETETTVLDETTSTDSNTKPEQKKNNENLNSFVEAVVTGVSDGDTITVSINGENHKVRLIGVDTPETKHPNKPVEYFGPEASKFTTEQLNGKTVYLEKDVSESDKYGRLLFYVWLTRPKTNEPTKDEINSYMFNARLLANGYARPLTYPPDVKYESILSEISRSAQEKYWGVWGEPVSSGEIATTETASPAQNTVVEQPVSVNIESSYIGNRNTGKFHYANCSSVDRMKESNKVPLSTREEAINSGYVPCKRCNP